MFHLGWFTGSGFGIQTWGAADAGESDFEWTQPEMYIRMAQRLESACFDYMMFEDSLMVTDTFRGTMEWTLRNGAGAPKNDPLPLMPIIAREAKHIGLVATIATTFTHPYSGARVGATLDHLTRGRFGLNLVTASSHRSAQNYGLEKHVEHDKRYDMAREWVEVCDKLWRSWKPGALVRDRGSGVYVDHIRVEVIEHEGEFYKSRGPLNAMPGPQIRPVMCQAGGSRAGRAFGAACADTIIGYGTCVGAMEAFREDLTKRLVAEGRGARDGFLVASPITARSIDEMSVSLAPALKKRGAIRTGYDHPPFRENLLAF